MASSSWFPVNYMIDWNLTWMNFILHEQQDIGMNSPNIETVKKQTTKHLPSKQFFHKQQLSWPDHDNIISSWLPDTSPVEALLEPAASFASRKLALKSEVNHLNAFVSSSVDNDRKHSHNASFLEGCLSFCYWRPLWKAIVYSDHRWVHIRQQFPRLSH